MKQFILIPKFKRLPEQLAYCLAHDKQKAAAIFTSRLNSFSSISWRPGVIKNFIREDNGQRLFNFN